MKTASLFLAEVKALKIISNDISFDIEGFAESFGIAFQIKNDLDNILTTKSDIEKILGIYLDKNEYNEVKDTLESINKRFNR